MDQSALIAVVEQEIKDLSSNFDAIDYTNAVSEACGETGWSFPITEAFQLTWIKRRTKRHLFYMLYVGSASKFKVDQINLQQKFEHYGKLLELEDKAYEKILESEPHQFANVSASQMFGHKIDAGFSYDRAGRSTTYRDSNLVVVNPTDTD